MKLSTEKNEDMEKLSNYFEKIETIADKMGVEIEDLMQEYKNNNTAAYANFKKSILEIAKQREQVFRQNENRSSDGQNVLSGMSILLKDENE